VRERRTASRYRLILPVVVRRVHVTDESDLFYGKTRDISVEGVYLTTYRQLARGTKLSLSLTLPLEITGTQVLVAAEAEVVRVEKRHEGFERVGMGASIQEFRIIYAQPGRS